MTDYSGVTWRVNYGEVSEREQFRVGYVGQDSFDAYFEVAALGELLSILTTVQGLGLGQMATGSTLQARKVDAGHLTEVAIEPRSDQFPPQIMRLELSTTPDLVYALQLFQTDLPGDPEPDDWDNTDSFMLDKPKKRIKEKLLPDRLSQENLEAAFAGAADVADLEVLTSSGRLGDAALKGTFVGPLSKSTGGAVPSAPLTYRNVDDFGAKGDATTDDRAAIQAAIDAGGNSSVIRFSPGKRYRIVGTLTTYLWQRLEGITSAFGSGSTSPVELFFVVSGSTPGIRARGYTHIKNLLVRGPGDAVGTCVGIQMFDSSSNALSLEDVSIDNWAVGVWLDQVYYGKLIRPAFRRNAVALKITSSLNITVFGIHINSLKADGTIGAGVQGTARALNLFGGSIEQCRTFISMTNGEALNAYGVYFETTLDSGFTDITGVQTAGANNTTVNLYGCYVYMPYIFSWVDSRTSTGFALNCAGNTFIAGVATSAPASAAAYRFTSGQIIDLRGDNWSKLEKVGTAYFAATGGAQPWPGALIRMPVGHALAGVLYDGVVKLTATDVQTLASAGPITVSTTFERAQITLQANLSALAFGGTAQNRQRLEVTFIQDATGGRTYTFPSQCRFAGGTAPSDTTANTRTTVGFQYDNVANRWHELYRVVAVPNS